MDRIEQRSKEYSSTPRGDESQKNEICALVDIHGQETRIIIGSIAIFVKKECSKGGLAVPFQDVLDSQSILRYFCHHENSPTSDHTMPTPKKFTIGLIQMAPGPDPEKNLRSAAARVEKASDVGAQIVCLPELFRSQDFCQSEDATLFDIAEPIPGPTTKTLGKLAKKLKVVLIAPLFERRTAGIYHNSAAIIDSTGEIVGLYRKMHIPDDPAYYEKFYFTPGDLGFQAFDTRVGRISALICWDQWYPEGARISSLRGASGLFYPTAIGWHPHEKKKHGKAQRDAWQTVQRGHAIANGIYVAAVNRVGFEKPVETSAGIEFWGSSFITDPQGVLIAESAFDKEEILLGEIDLEHLEDVRRNWPFLRDRRIDAYDGITSRFLGNSPSDTQR